MTSKWYTALGVVLGITGLSAPIELAYHYWTKYKKGITLANKDDEASYRAESDISTKEQDR